MRARSPASGHAPPVDVGRVERSRYLALDALLSLEELAGLTLSNRPQSDHGRGRAAVGAVLVADRFPARGDPLVELAGAVGSARVEAVARPVAPDVDVARRIAIDYLEDDGAAVRLSAALGLILRHPLRCALDFFERGPDTPSLRSLAPAARRLEHDAGARVHALGGERSRAIAERLARLAGRDLGS